MYEPYHSHAFSLSLRSSLSLAPSRSLPLYVVGFLSSHTPITVTLTICKAQTYLQALLVLRHFFFFPERGPAPRQEYILLYIP